MNVFFDVQEMYYLPQYESIKKQLIACEVAVVFVFYGVSSVSIDASKDLTSMCNGAVLRFVGSEAEAKELYLEERPNWIVFGNQFSDLVDIQKYSKTALVGHGIGPKSCYYTVSDTPTDVRFVEGPYREKRLKDMYPDQTFIDTGYAKLDPVVNGELSDVRLSDYGLDDSKRTILYAPTFYPSSIECFKSSFPLDFSEYNIILKPHYFSLSIPKYRKQKNLLEGWSKYNNVYLAPIEESNILPFMVISDVLISEASSTLFEFAALGKPVVWCDFLKLRWGYRGILKFRFKKRMDQDLYRYSDIAAHAKSYRELKSVVDTQIMFPEQYEVQRSRYTLSLAGIVDGKASNRIVQYLIENS